LKVENIKNYLLQKEDITNYILIKLEYKSS
jgi:hypothetical protein